MIQRQKLAQDLHEYLRVSEFKDYCPNGLQVEGKQEIKRLVTGTTASQALIDEAIERKADAILVHHGLFWSGDAFEVVGMKKHRLKALLAHDINLFAYHLPLDAHPEVGNNVGLAKTMGWQISGGLDATKPYSVGLVGQTQTPQTLDELCQSLAKRLNRIPMVIGDKSKRIQQLAWCTGAAQKMIDRAASKGVDVYISGEISEPTYHSAVEQDIAYIAAGHHATETFGVRLLGQYIADKFGIEVIDIDINNPV